MASDIESYHFRFQFRTSDTSLLRIKQSRYVILVDFIPTKRGRSVGVASNSKLDRMDGPGSRVHDLLFFRSQQGSPVPLYAKRVTHAILDTWICSFSPKILGILSYLDKTCPNFD